MLSQNWPVAWDFDQNSLSLGPLWSHCKKESDNKFFQTKHLLPLDKKKQQQKKKTKQIYQVHYCNITYTIIFSIVVKICTKRDFCSWLPLAVLELNTINYSASYIILVKIMESYFHWTVPLHYVKFFEYLYMYSIYS